MVAFDPHKVGMSDLAGVAGISRWKSPISVFQRVKGIAAEEEPSLPLEFGQHTEPFLIGQWQKMTGGTVKSPRSIMISGRPWMRATLDADAELQDEPLVVEAKTAGWRMSGEWGEGNDEIPIDYLCQVQGYLWATKYHRADVVVLLGGSDLRIYNVLPDLELQEMLVDAADKFQRDYIEKNIPPPPDGSEAYREFLVQRYPRHERQLLRSTPEIDMMVLRYHAAARSAEMAEEAASTLKNQLRAVIADAEGIEGSWGRISYKQNKPTFKTDWEALARELSPPEHLIQKHTTSRPGPRVFRTTFKEKQS